MAPPAAHRSPLLSKKNEDLEVVLTFKAPTRLKERIDKQAWRERCSRSEMIRRLCLKGLSKN